VVGPNDVFFKVLTDHGNLYILRRKGRRHAVLKRHAIRFAIREKMHYFTIDYAIPGPGKLGTCGISTEPGPGIKQVDMSQEIRDYGATVA
jgi:hypothetical protein